MKKLIALLKAKDGLDRQQFIDRYELQHAPLIGRLLPFFVEYRRAFPLKSAVPDHLETAPLPDYFDVITELWYRDAAAIDRQVEVISGEIGQLVADDEREQFDRTRMIMFEAEEHVTSVDRLRPAPAGGEGNPPIRLTGLLRKRAGMTRQEFIDYYEGRHSRLAVELLRSDGHALFARYTRSYPAQFLPIGEGPETTSVDFDVITDMWFWGEGDYRRFLEMCADENIAASLITDETQLFDRSAVQSFLTTEFITSGSPNDGR